MLFKYLNSNLRLFEHLDLDSATLLVEFYFRVKCNDIILAYYGYIIRLFTLVLQYL